MFLDYIMYRLKEYYYVLVVDTTVVHSEKYIFFDARIPLRPILSHETKTFMWFAAFSYVSLLFYYIRLLCSLMSFAYGQKLLRVLFCLFADTNPTDRN